MAIKYKVKVINATLLNVRNKAGISGKIVAVMKNGDTAIVDDIKTLADGAKWMRISNSNTWCCQKTASGTTYLKIVEDLLKKSSTSSNKDTSSTSSANKNGVASSNPTKGKTTKTDNPSSDSTRTTSGIPSTNNTKGVYTTGSLVLFHETVTTHHPGSGSFDIITHDNFPSALGDGGADYSMVYSSEITDALNMICKNLNTPNAYTTQELNKHYHLNFNRFRVGFPDIFMKNTIPVIFFTRPDLNLFLSDGIGGTLPVVNSQVSKDPRTHGILLKDIKLGQLLTQDCMDLNDHNFNPLLSNFAESLEIQDDSVDLLETGETFTGYKMQYSKHNIKSITSGTLNIKYKESFDAAILNMHQIWVDYQSNVYKGVFSPKMSHIYNAELDYACNIYYFLLDQDFETIRFWSKYYGVFPNNVPKSTFGFDFGSQVQFPELTVTYSYIYKEDLSPTTLIEFNQDAGDKPYEYIMSYEPTVNHGGRTWVGTPFVESYIYDNGINSKAEGFRLRWRAINGEAAVNGISFSDEYVSPRGNKPATYTPAKNTNSFNSTGNNRIKSSRGSVKTRTASGTNGTITAKVTSGLNGTTTTKIGTGVNFKK